MEVGKNPFEGNKTTNLYTNTTVSQTSDLQSLDNSENMSSIFEDDISYSNNDTLNCEILEENDIELIKKELQRYINELKDDLGNSKNTKGFLSSMGNEIAEIFNNGDKGKENQIQDYENLLNSLDENPQYALDVYQQIKGVELNSQDLNSLKTSNSLANSLDNETQSAIVEELENQLSEIEADFKSAKDSNGWISGTWNTIKNATGIGASSNKTQAEINSIKEELEALKNGETDLASAYKNITGKDFSQSELESLANGETNLSETSSAGQSIEKYKEGQKMVVDTVADVTSGIVAVGAAALAPVTGGASLLVAGGVGAALKVGIKASDCIGNEKTYKAADAVYDLATGFVNGAMSPLTNGLGGAAGTGVAKAFGLRALESTAKEGLEQATKCAGKEIIQDVVQETVEQTGKGLLTKILAKQGSEYVLKEGAEATLKTTIGKFAAYGADMMVDGSLSGAADGAIRAVAEGRPEDILSDTFNGLIGGAIASPIIGGGMRAATKLGSTTKNYANDLIDGFNFAEKAYNNPNIKKISKNFVEFSPELEPVISFLVTDEQFNKYISKKGIKEELQNLIYMLKSTNSDSFTNFKSNLKANITQSDISETVASDSTDMMERIIINLKDITSGNYAPSGEVLAGNSTDDIANGLYLKFRAETQGEIQGLYKSIAEKTSDLVMDSSTMPNNSSYFNKEITEDDIIKQYQKIIELFGVGPTKMAQNLSGDDTKMADFFINLIQKIDDSSFDLSDFDLDKQMSYMQQAMKNTKSGCSFTRTEEEALREFSSLFPEKGIKSVKKMSAASIGETFLVNCDDGTEEGVNIIIKAIKNGVSRDSLEEENNLIAHVINSIANDEQQQQANELVKMLNSLYGDFSEELDFGNEAHANSLLKKTLKRSKVAEVLEVSSDGRALTMELAQGIQANKLMTILKTYKNDLEYREAIDDMISEYKLDPDNFQLEKYLNEDVYEKRIGTYAKILKDNPAMSEPIEIMRKLSNAEISSFCEQMIFVKKIDGSTGTIMHGDPHSGNFFINFDENNNPIMQYIDTGNVVVTDSKDVTNNLKFFLNYFIGNTDGMAEYLLNNCDNMTNELDLSPEELKKYISEKIKDEIFSINIDGKEIGQNITRFNEIYESITTLLNNLGLSINAESANYYKAQGMFLDAISDSTSLLGDSGFSIYSIIKDCPQAVVKMIQNNINPTDLIKSVLSFIVKNPNDSVGNMWQFVLSERKNINTVKENIAAFK